jgi:uncharacterized membrane protein YdjX (TVP38/TMEM64 family)
MRELIRVLLIVVVALLIPIVPFLALGESFEQKVSGWLHAEPTPTAAAVSIGILVSDILLPVPSSIVLIVNGHLFGVAYGTVVSWLGVTVGAVLGFALARAFGRPLAKRLCREDDMTRIEHLTGRHGPTVLVLTRALPVLAEATVLLMGATELSWRRFFLPVALSNLGLAVAYAAVGSLAGHDYGFLIALSASVAVPALATSAMRMVPMPPAAAAVEQE